MVRANEKSTGKRPRTDDGSSSQAPPPTYNITRGTKPKWPREENTRIPVEFEPLKRGVTLRSVLTSDEVEKREVSAWDAFDSLLYNEWLKVPIASTKFIDSFSLGLLNIRDEVEGLIGGMGLSKLVEGRSIMYPDLVRQFFATVNLSSRAETQEESKDPRHFYMSFKANGKLCNMNAHTVCRIFGFPEVPLVGLPKDIYGGVQTLWSRIGTGPYVVGSSAQADVRHPVARYLIRLLTTTIMCKMEPVKVRSYELVLLSYALREIIHNETWDTVTPNMGMVLMEYLHSLKYTPLSVTNFGKKQLPIGSILTPIFERCKMPMDDYTSELKVARVDVEHMKNAHWITQEHPLHWVFPIANGQKRKVAFEDVRDLLRVTNDPSVISFNPPEEVLKPMGPTRKLTTRGGASSSQTPPEQPLHEHRFPSLPPGLMDDNPQLSWIAKALKATWDAMSCKSDCVRPRTPSPRHTPSPQPSEHHDDEEEE